MSTESAPVSTPSVTKHFAANKRDILLFFFLGIVFAVLSDLLVSISTRQGWSSYIPSLGSYLQGVSRFVAVNATASVIGLYAWPTFLKFGVQRWQEGWESLGVQGQTIAYIAVLCMQGLIAAICFN